MQIPGDTDNNTTPIDSSVKPLVDINGKAAPGTAWTLDPTTKLWIKPTIPSDNKIYTWDDNKGYVDTGKVDLSKLTTSTGFVLSTVLISDGTYGVDSKDANGNTILGLKSIYNLWASGKETEAFDAYFKSDWYTKLGKTAAQRYAMSLQQNPVYLQELEAYKLEQKQRLVQLGVKIDDPKLDEYLKTAYDGALTDIQVNTLVAKSSDFGHTFSGSILVTIQNAKEYARSMGVSYGEDAYTQWGKRLFLGEMTDSEVQQNIRETAASAFPVYRDLILKGVTMDSISSAYKQSMANILEINPNSIDVTSDQTLRRALQGMATGKDGGGGNGMPLWEFENQLRQDVRWQYTNNAREQSYNMVNQVLSDFGLKG